MYKYDERPNKGYDPTYWCEKGKYQKQYDFLHPKLVPGQGKASTKEGELLRCVVNFYYDRFNNGHCNDKSYEKRVVNAWLRGQKDAPVKSIAYRMLDKDLDAVMDFLLVWVINRCGYMFNPPIMVVDGKVRKDYDQMGARALEQQVEMEHRGL